MTRGKKREKKNKIILIGIDEAGRGALAGPVVAAAVTIKTSKSENQKLKVFQNLKDSKKLTQKKREEIFEILKKNPQIKWATAKVGPKVIDKINILQATKLAMKRAIQNLNSKFFSSSQRFALGADKIQNSKLNLLIDGNFKIDLDIPQHSIVKGDEKVFLIKLASIVAKVWRDKIMLNYHKKYPQYRFDKHKGYGTKLHLQILEKHKPCKIHRKTFKPVREIKN